MSLSVHKPHEWRPFEIVCQSNREDGQALRIAALMALIALYPPMELAFVGLLESGKISLVEGQNLLVDAMKNLQTLANEQGRQGIPDSPQLSLSLEQFGSYLDFHSKALLQYHSTRKVNVVS